MTTIRDQLEGLGLPLDVYNKSWCQVYNQIDAQLKEDLLYKS